MASTLARICVIGSSNIDLTFRTTHLPSPGETLAARTFHLGVGGKGANQAVMAARLGASVSVITKVGRDVFGDQTRQNYEREGIDTRHICIDDSRPSGLAAIMVGDDARNCILVALGANSGLSPHDVQEAR